MIPGGTFEGIIEGRSADNDVAHEIIEYRASPHRKISAFNGPKHGITSNTAVHKLLKCPVCVNVMFPPRFTRLRHEQNCKYCPYKCPYTGADCPISGSIQFLVDHLKRDHNVDMHAGCTFNLRYVKSNPQDVENATWMLTVFNCYGYQFCLHFEGFNLGMAPVYMAFICFMGDDHDTRKFSYSLVEWWCCGDRLPSNTCRQA